MGAPHLNSGFSAGHGVAIDNDFKRCVDLRGIVLHTTLKWHVPDQAESLVRAADFPARGRSNPPASDRIRCQRCPTMRTPRAIECRLASGGRARCGGRMVFVMLARMTAGGVYGAQEKSLGAGGIIRVIAGGVNPWPASTRWAETIPGMPCRGQNNRLGKRSTDRPLDGRQRFGREHAAIDAATRRVACGRANRAIACAI